MGSIEEARDIFSKDLYATELSGIEIDDLVPSLVVAPDTYRYCDGHGRRMVYGHLRFFASRSCYN
jgi:hypothetical protein